MSITKNAFIGIFSKIGILIIIFANNFLILKMLGPKWQGVFFLIIITNGLLLNFLNFGINISNITFLAKDNSLFGKINSNTITLSFMTGAISVAIYFAVFGLFHNYLIKEISPLYLLLSFMLIPFAMYELMWTSMMVGLNEIILLNTYQFFKNLSVILLNFLLLVVFKSGFNGAFLGWVFIVIASFFVMITISNRRERLQLAFHPGLFKEMLSFGIKNYWGNVASNIWKRFDTYAIGVFNGASFVGYYSLAVNLRDVVWQLIEPISNAIFPKITSLSRKESVELTCKVSRHTVLNSLLISVSFIILGCFGIKFFLGKVYEQSIMPLVILLIGTSGVSLSMVLSIYVIGQINRPGLVSVLAWINTFVNAALCLILIPRYNVVGAALSSTIMCFFGGLVMVLVFKKFSGHSFADVVLVRIADLGYYRDIFGRFLDKLNLATIKNGLREKL